MLPNSRFLHTAYIGLGSNLASRAGSPQATLTSALASLAALAEESPPVCSSFYVTRPVGKRDQPAFLNAAAGLKTPLGSEALFEALLAIECDHGRVRAIPNGPRTLDLDLLFFDDLVLSTSRLVLPHPRLHLRRFVLAPLCEIAPALRHPIFGCTVAQLFHALPDHGEQAADGVQRL